MIAAILSDDEIGLVELEGAAPALALGNERFRRLQVWDRDGDAIGFVYVAGDYAGGIPRPVVTKLLSLPEERRLPPDERPERDSDG